MLASGSRLGAYEILAPLGAGGMGEVYRARDLRLGREVAIKILPEEFASNAERLARFEREARTVAGLNHPNIVTLFSVEDEAGVRFLTMELIEGETLSRLVSPGGLSASRIVDLAGPLAEALVAAHERGVIHRDLKPGNVMVTRDDRLKILDFGLARMTGREREETLTASGPLSGEGRLLGTVPYMAPEQLRGEIADARSDLFALGVILFELAAGRRPFSGVSSADIASSILRDEPERLSGIRPDLPPDLDRLVSDCLEKNPRERVQTALDVSNALRRLRGALEHGTQGAKAKPVASIAVLPFVNRSPSSEDEYFSDGLTDELLNVLAKIKGLRVTARTSAFHFKGKDVTIPEVGRALNVATILEGSVRKSGKRVRISVELVKVSDGSHLWSETYDRTFDDIFAVQDDIAQSVVKELRTALLGGESDSYSMGQAKADVAAAAKGRGTDPEAHRLYLLARHLLGRGSQDDTAKAVRYLNEALDRDPRYALAWAEMARAYIMEGGHGWVPAAEGYERARDAVERALGLEPDLAEAHARLGWIRKYQDWDVRSAESSYRHALALSPGNAEVLRGAGMLARARRQIEEPVELLRRALEQDPLSAVAYHSLGIALHDAGRYAEAETAYRKALELAPQRILAHASLALTLLALNRGDEALAAALLEPQEVFRLWSLAIVHHGLGRGAESDAALRELIERYSEDAACQIAEVEAIRGDVDRAFEWLERAYAQRDAGIPDATSSPWLRGLHGDARWSAFLTKMGIEV
ncbi:MAG TPA: protein kinase [Candidatus Eisenbacteria bacterium]|nr:protein kinase [Candidatus Eisenbacteria bacterium]